MSNAIGLEIPSRVKPNKDSFDSKPKNVERWVEALPRASVGRCAELIFNLLTQVNSLEMRYKDRVFLLESLRDPVQYVSQAMQKHFIGARFPLPKKSQNIAHATRKIYNLMATGYKIAIEDQLKSTLFLKDKNLLSTNIHRSMSYLSRVLLTTYQVYAPLPNKIWGDLNKLYAYAEKEKLHRNQISDVQHQYIKKTSIVGEYLRILLLSLAAPNRLHHGEVDHVYVNLERWMRLTKLNKIAEKDNDSYDFVIDCDRDKPPNHFTLSQDTSSVNIRVFNTDVLTQELYDELQLSEEIVSKTLVTIKMPTAKLSHDLLRRLIVSWGPIQERKFGRVISNDKVNVSIGLSAVHQTILSDFRNKPIPESFTIESQSSDDVLAGQSNFYTKNVIDVKDIGPDIWDTVYEKNAIMYNEPNSKSTNDSETKVNTYEQSQDWLISNYSEGGFNLKNLNENSNKIQVGEIIGFKLSLGTDDIEQWFVGIIRWMNTIGRQGVEIGGEFIGVSAVPVGISLMIDDLETKQVQRALLVPGDNEDNSIITFLSNYRVGASINIQINKSKLSVKLMSERDDLGLYQQFYYETTDAKRTNKPSSDDSKEFANKKDMDDVWSIL
ncbi:hypothetical protein MNBD_GAMMA22-2596 [hydrothermal vent metagenome]|uniref:DnaK-related protein n=1 Tax=hydrothermal vent metagenome TaxID=652676 RepID=A0A3B1A8E1_9ZZZZ